MKSFIVFLFLLFLPSNTDCITYNDSDKLFQNLFAEYNKEIRPGINHSVPLIVYVQYYLVEIKGFDELEGNLITIGNLEVTWNDHRIRWDPAQYGGINEFLIRQELVWLPEMHISNSRSVLTGLRIERYNIPYKSDGTGNLAMYHTAETNCESNPTNFPFEQQTCRILYTPNGYSNNQLKFATIDPAVISVVKRDGLWRLNSVNHTIGLYFGNYEYIQISVTFSREPSFFIVTLLVPIVVLAILHVFAFLIPISSGERIGYSVTLFLASGVYLSLISESLPTTSKPGIANICYKLACDVVLAGLIIICNIISVMFYNKDDNISGHISAFTNGLFSTKEETTRNHYMEQSENKNYSMSDVNNGRLKQTTKRTWKEFSSTLDTVFIIVFTVLTITDNVVFLIIVLVE